MTRSSKKGKAALTSAKTKGPTSTPSAGPASLRQLNVPTVDSLCKSIKASKDTHLHAKKTKEGYAGYVRRGKEFLAALVKVRREVRAVAGREAAGEDEESDIDVDVLALAFENPPNQYSAFALELFLTEKCVNQKKGESTCEGIYSAFKKAWEMMYVFLRL